MTDQKPNCSNCDKKKCPYHKRTLELQSEDLRTTNCYKSVTADVGCLSHPDARAYLMRELSTPELVEALCKRDCVKNYIVTDDERTYILDKTAICIGGAVSINGYGAATILVVKE